MRAVTFTEYGPPEVLKLTEVATPAPKANEILIKIYATTVNTGDLWARNFKAIALRDFSMSFPMWVATKLLFGINQPRIRILGAELAGEIAAVGSKVTRFQVGDQVFGYRGPAFGGNAEYLCMPESGLVAHMPTNLSFAEAAALPYGTMTAKNLLRKVDLQPGQTILINGASGGIGSYAVQFAKHAGAEVTGVCSTAKVELVRVLGADHVIDYTQADFTQNGRRYDVIFDILGRSSFARCKGSLTPNGRYLLASFKTPQLLQMLQTSMRNGKKVICALSTESQADLLEIKVLAEAGVIQAHIDRSFPLAEVAAAHRYVEAGHKQGSVVITVAES